MDGMRERAAALKGQLQTVTAVHRSLRYVVVGLLVKGPVYFHTCRANYNLKQLTVKMSKYLN